MQVLHRKFALFFLLMKYSEKSVYMQYIGSISISKMKQQTCIKFEYFDILTIHCSFCLSYLMFLLLICFLNMQVRLKSEQNCYSVSNIHLSTARAAVLWRIISFSNLNHLIKIRKKKKSRLWGFILSRGFSGWCLSIISFTSFKTMDLGGVWLSLLEFFPKQ